MRNIRIGLALLAVAVAASAEEQTPRVEAREKTVVTVHASPDRLETARSPQQKKSRFKLGAFKALAGAGNGAGWLLNSSDDIPSAREREFRSRQSR